MKKCDYCLGGYCRDIDVKSVELTADGGREWNLPTDAGKECREYLRGSYRFTRQCPVCALNLRTRVYDT